MRIEGIGIGLRYPGPGESAAVALANAMLRLPETGMIAVTGPSGCGKSSLLYVLSGLRAPTEGTVYYDDADIASFSAAELSVRRRARFGFVFQRAFLLESFSALDNVLIPMNRKDAETQARAEKLLDWLGLQELGHRKPSALSQGQRQRVAVARALIHNPRVIFADEPTAALDRASTDAVMDLLVEYAAGAIVLIISHDPAVLNRADRVVAMRDGRILPNP